MELKSAQRLTISLQQGTLYHIYCIGSELCIRQQDQPNDDPVVVASMPCELDMRQLWYVTKQDNRFHIVNAYSALAMTEKHGMIYLKPPLKKSKQLYKFTMPWSKDSRGVVIRKDNAQTRAVCLYGALLYREIDPNNENHIFRFEPMKSSIVFHQSTVLMNAHTRKVLDVPNLTKKKGELLVQKTESPFLNLNQHWMFNQFRATPGGYFIQNLFSRMVIDCKSKPKVRHYDFEYYSYQLWYLEQVGQNQFKIHAMDDRSKVLGIIGDSVNEQANVGLVPEDSPSGSWHFIGHIPLQFQPEVQQQVIVQKKSVVIPPSPVPIPQVVTQGSQIRVSGVSPPKTSIVFGQPQPSTLMPPKRISELYAQGGQLSPSQVAMTSDPRSSLLNMSIRPSDAYFEPRTFLPPPPIVSINKSPQIEVVKMPVQVSEMKIQKTQSQVGTYNPTLTVPALSVPASTVPLPTYHPPPAARLRQSDIPDLKITTPYQQQKRLV